MPLFSLNREMKMFKYAKDGDSNAPGKKTCKRGSEEKQTSLPALRQAHPKGRHSTHCHRAGLLAAVELGGGTAFHISTLDILAGPWRHTADGIPGQYLHVRGRPQAEVCK
jgi:hypothetical protein